MAEPARAAPPAPPAATSTSTAPSQSSMRVGLRMLRATLRNMGIAKGSDAIRTFDAHAKWILARLGDPPPPPDAPKAAVDPLGSYEDARELCLAIALTVIRSVAGRPDAERREVIDRAYLFEDDVREALYHQLLPRRAARRSTTASPPPAHARGSR